MQQLQLLNSQQDELKMSQARPNMERHLTQVECMLVRETMLKQEKMYREQVQALHYLYEVQKTLMDDLRRKTFAKQEIMTDLNSTVRPRDYQFFPPKAEEKAPGVRRNFDLEKLPDECLDDEEDLKPLRLNCNGDTNVDLFLRCGTTDHPDESQIPKRLRRENIHDLTQSDRYNLRNGRIQNSQHHWFLQGPEISSWSSKPKQLPGLSLNSGYFQLEIPRNSNSWLQTQQPLSHTDNVNRSQRFGTVKTGDLAPAVILGGNGLQDAPWYGEQRITVQQNPYALQVNASSNAIHPWHAAGAVYFSDSYLRTANVSQTRLSETKVSAKPSSKWFGEQEEVFPSYLQRKDSRHLRNGNTDNDAFHVFRREVGSKGAGLGDRMYHTGRNLSGAVDYWVTQGDKLTKHNAQADDLNIASSDNKQNVALLPGHSEQKESYDVDKLAASILLSLILDKTTPLKEEINPPFLKELATVFNDAIQAEEETGCSDMEAECGNATTPELDHFEFATLRLKESSQVDHIPETIAVEPDPTPPKSTTTTSGRPSRTGRKQRDFRNDTLPSIMSLSRQEITEDFQIMSGLVRSTSRDNTEMCTINNNNNSRRGGAKFCSISRLDSARASPVSTLDLRQSPCSKRKSSRRAAAAAAAAASCQQEEQAEQDEQEEDEQHEESASVLPWLVSWAESTRRKRMQRQRLKRPVKLFAALSSRGGRKRGCT